MQRAAGSGGQGRWQREANDGKLVNNYTNRIMKLKPEEQREVAVGKRRGTEREVEEEVKEEVERQRDG